MIWLSWELTVQSRRAKDQQGKRELINEGEEKGLCNGMTLPSNIHTPSSPFLLAAAVLSLSSSLFNVSISVALKKERGNGSD